MASPTSGTALARVSFPLLENGLDFLASAVEHLRGDPSQRELKYALLHLASGIELVLKERLRRHDPAQLYQRPERFDATDFAAGNFQSGNASETVKRLVDLAGVTISDADRTQLHLLRERRNRAEHFGDDGHRALIAVLGCAGLRATEAAELNVGDVSLPHGKIFVRDSKTDAGVRQVDMSPRLQREIAAYLAARPMASPLEPAFPTRTGARRDKDNIRNRVVAPAVRRATATGKLPACR